MEVTAMDPAPLEWDPLAGSGRQSLPLESAFDPFASSSSAGPRPGLSAVIAAIAVGFADSAYLAGSAYWDTRELDNARDYWLKSARDIHSDQHEQTESLVTRSIDSVLNRLQLTRSQLAAALGVERATLYQWQKGVQPRAKARQRLVAVEQFAREWTDAQLGSARASWHFRAPGGGASRTLGQLLSAEQLDTDALRGIIRAATSGPLEMAPLQGVSGFPAEDPLEERRRRHDRYPPSYPSKE